MFGLRPAGLTPLKRLHLMPFHIPPLFRDALAAADSSWHAILSAGLDAVVDADPAYLPTLAKDDFLPTKGRLFAAFKLPLDSVRYVLVGESPYPREASATGVCFMDGAVGSLWSETGLSKQVNRATSLRNFMKMLLVAHGKLSIANTGGDALAPIAEQARADTSDYVQTLADLQHNMMEHGFLLLNATLVFRPDVAPFKEAKAWRPFLQTVLQGLADHFGVEATPQLVLWGKIADQLNALPVTAQFPKLQSEHPYNLSFIGNATMQGLFRPMNLLRR